MKAVKGIFRLLMIGVGILIFLLFLSQPYIPENMVNVDTKDVFFMAVFNTIGVFTLATDITIAREFLTPCKYIPQEIFSLWIYVLFAVAPLFLITNILTYFRVGTDRVLYEVSKIFGVSYVFSELNEKSITMAESIRKEKKNSFIVFVGCNIYGTDNSKEHQLIERARQINAICLKKDLVALEFSKLLFGANHFFVISENESQNVSQCISMIEKYKNRKFKNAIYAYVSLDSDIALIDSVDKGNELLNERFRAEMCKSPKRMFDADPYQQEMEIEGRFTVRCINTAEETAIRLLGDCYDEIVETAKKHNNNILISIVGMGRYGFEMLKAAVWMMQLSGFYLTVHIYDKNPNTEKILMQRCPELLSKRYKDGDANHEIKVYSGVDCDTVDFERLIRGNNPKENVQIQLVFVALGEDNRNIDVAMRIRQMISVQMGKEKDEEVKRKMPRIYAVAKDKDISCVSNINNYKNQRYDISFCGSYDEEYSFETIRKLRVREKIAFRHHIDWITDDKEFLEEAKGYAQFSYFRKSSMAMEIHREHVKNYVSDLDDETKKVLEHMRWNAYMRGLGYQFSQERYDLAKLHPCLVQYDELSEQDKEKDIINYTEKHKELMELSEF